MSHNLLLVSLMLIAGGMAAAQSAINARLAGFLASPVQASFVSFCVGSAALLLVLALMREGLPSPVRLARAPPAYLLGGFCGVAFITTAIFLVPRIGVVNVLFAGLAGQAIVSVLIDHHGLFGLARHPVNGWKVAGLALVCVGVLLLKREAPPVRTTEPPQVPAAAHAATARPSPAPSAPSDARRPALPRSHPRRELQRIKARIRRIHREPVVEAIAERPDIADRSATSVRPRPRRAGSRPTRPPHG